VLVISRRHPLATTAGTGTPLPGRPALTPSAAATANITGIAPAAPGFRAIRVRPRPGGEVRSAEGRYDSLHGPVATRWTQRGEDFGRTVSLPVNTTAEAWVPARREADVTQRGARFLHRADGCAAHAADSGSHHFLTRTDLRA
jgi:alpha-L-rhamnosidase